MRVMIDGVERDATPEEIAEHEAFVNATPEYVTPKVLYPVDLWSRLTDEEAEQVEAVMATQPVRVQNIFKSASSYRDDHELWPLLVGMATQLFGKTRAAQILAPS